MQTRTRKRTHIQAHIFVIFFPESWFLFRNYFHVQYFGVRPWYVYNSVGVLHFFHKHWWLNSSIVQKLDELIRHVYSSIVYIPSFFHQKNQHLCMVMESSLIIVLVYSLSFRRLEIYLYSVKTRELFSILWRLQFLLIFSLAQMMGSEQFFPSPKLFQGIVEIVKIISYSYKTNSESG